MVILFSSLCACKEKEEEFKIHSIEEGFNYINASYYRSPFAYVAYRAETNLFEIDSVKIDIAYGLLDASWERSVPSLVVSFFPIECMGEGGYNVEDGTISSKSIKDVRLYNRKILYKEIKDFTMDEYRIDIDQKIAEEEKVMDGYSENALIFNHYETVIIPKDLFCYEFGKIGILMEGEDLNYGGIWENGGKFSPYRTINYVKKDEKIYLYSEKEYYNVFMELIEWPEVPKFDDSIK